MPAASPRHHNCFYYFRGPAERGVAAADVDRQVEDNTTKALINVLEHCDRSVLRSFIERFVPVADSERLDEAEFFLQGGPDAIPSRRGLLAVSVDGDLPLDVATEEDGGSRVDAAIVVPASWLVVIEVKTAGSLSRPQLIRHCKRWKVDAVKPGQTDPSSWRVIRWREVYDWAAVALTSDTREPTKFLLNQFVEYLELAGLAPTSRFLPEHFEFFGGDPADRSEDLKVEIKTRLETIWELVKDQLGALREEVEPTYVGPIKAADSQAWAQSNRGGGGVNFTIELDNDGLQLNIVAGTQDQLSEFDPWLASDQAALTASQLSEYELVLHAREPRSRQSDGRPIWRGAHWRPVRTWPIESVAGPDGVNEIAKWRAQIESDGARHAFHLRRNWSPSEVLTKGEELVPEFVQEIERLTPILREIRLSQTSAKRGR